MTKKQEPKFIHSKNMKENRYILSFIIFLLGSLSIHSQTHRDLRTTVEEALVSLKPEHLAIGEIKLDTLLLEKGNKLVVQMNDEFSYLPFISPERKSVSDIPIVVISAFFYETVSDRSAHPIG